MARVGIKLQAWERRQVDFTAFESTVNDGNNIALSQHLKDQLIALEEIEEHFDKANIDLHSKIENSYHQLSTHIADHQQHIIVEKQQFHKEQSIIKGTTSLVYTMMILALI